MVMLFYILSSMTWIVSNSTIKGAEQISILLMLSSIVCGLLTVLILFYLNGYVIKQRSREFGLYSVLGLGKMESLSADILGNPLLMHRKPDLRDPCRRCIQSADVSSPAQHHPFAS